MAFGLPSRAEASPAATGDFNGDGVPDIVALSSSGIQIMLGTGKIDAPFETGAAYALSKSRPCSEFRTVSLLTRNSPQHPSDLLFPNTAELTRLKDVVEVLLGRVLDCSSAEFIVV
jgi:hypothetical protein